MKGGWKVGDGGGGGADTTPHGLVARGRSDLMRLQWGEREGEREGVEKK